MPGSPVCVDASFVIALVTSEVHSGAALARWAEWMEGGSEAIAPMLLRHEVTSALWRKAVRGAMTSRDARWSVKEPLNLNIALLDPPSSASVRSTLRSASTSLPPTKTQYLALAEMAGAELWAADERLHCAAQEVTSSVRLLGNP